jgi:UDP-glucose:(heptosyl)LPS alpha-1,3-glucosyltransferase
LVRSMKFATAIPHFSESRGGAERYLVGLCRRMAEEGSEVHVYAESWEPKHPKIHFHRVRTVPFPKSLRLLSFAITASRDMEKGRYDVTLGVGNTLRADVLQPHGGVHWAWFWRSLMAYDHPILWVLKWLGRVFSPKQWVAGYIEDAPYRARKLSKIIAISDMVRRDILRWYEVPENQVHVIYNGVDTKRFHPRNRQYRDDLRRKHHIGEEKVILFVSNNFRMKGLSYLMKALSHLKTKGVSPFKLLILGRDRQGPYLRLATRLRIAGDVIFAGSSDEPEKYYGAADLLVHPTFYDACSLTVLEALASGLPVITTASNGASGVIRREEEGQVIDDPRNLNQLGTAIEQCLDRKGDSVASQETPIRVQDLSEERNYDGMVRVFSEARQFAEVRRG